MTKEKLPKESNSLKLFEGSEIRSVWNEEEGEWYFSVVDVVQALTDSPNPRDYWYRVKKRMDEEEKAKLSTICRQLKLESSDGKKYKTDASNTKGVLRIIQSIPSPKAEPFKQWLAKVGSERIDEEFDPELAVARAVESYRRKGYTAKEISKSEKPATFVENQDVVRRGGKVAGIARKAVEESTGKPVVTDKNYLPGTQKRIEE